MPELANGLAGGWELLAPERNEASQQSAAILYLHAVGASDHMVRTYLFRPLEGLMISLDRSRLTLRHLGGTVAGCPPEEFDLDGDYNVVYNDAGRQWARLVQYHTAQQFVELERVGPQNTFPIVKETLALATQDSGREILLRTITVTSFLGLEIYRGVQRFLRMSEVQVHNRRQSLDPCMPYDKVEGHIRDLGSDVLILGVHNAEAQEGACRLVFSCGSTFQEYVIGVAGIRDRKPYIVHRRYREFRAFFETLCTLEPMSDFPAKTIFHPTGEVLFERRRQLQHFLQRVLQMDIPRDHEAWRSQRNFFLGSLPPRRTRFVEQEMPETDAPERVPHARRPNLADVIADDHGSDPLTKSLEFQNHLRAQSVRPKRDSPRNMRPGPLSPGGMPGSPLQDLFEQEGFHADAEVFARPPRVAERQGRLIGAVGVSRRANAGPHAAGGGSDDAFFTPRNSEKHELPPATEGESSGSFANDVRGSRSGSESSVADAGFLSSGIATPQSGYGTPTSRPQEARKILSAAARLLGQDSAVTNEESDEEDDDADSAQDSLVIWLSPGVLVTKHSSRGHPYPRVLYFHEEKQVIFWTKTGERPRPAKGKTIAVRDVRNVYVLSPLDGSPMRRTAKSKQEIQELEAHFPFARCVRLETLRRSWDFQMESADTAEKLVRGLHELMRSRRSRRRV